MNKREILLDPDLNVGDTLEKAKKLAARATKKGLSGGYTVTTETRLETNEKTGQVFEQTYLIVEGSPAKYNGWTFLAFVEWVNGLPLVFSSPWSEVEIDRSLLVEGSCDHCETVRTRKSVIVVENEAGERKQVGKQCAKDFLGQDSPVTWFAPASDVFAEFDGYEGYGLAVYKISQILTFAASVVRQRGWVRSGVGWSTDVLQEIVPTKKLVELLLGPPPSNKQELALRKELQAGFDAEKDQAVALEAFEFGTKFEGWSDYALNAKAALSVGWDGYLAPKTFGLVVSVAGVYIKKIEKDAQKASESEGITEEVYAEPKTKIEITGAEVIRVTPVDTAYGLSEIFILIADGYRFKWFTSSAPKLDVGDVVNFKATVKGEDTWNEQVSTSVLRLKIVA